MPPSPPKLALGFLALLLAGCADGPPAPPPGAVVPAPPVPGTPIAGGLQIVSAQISPRPLLDDNVTSFRKGTVSVQFNGAATSPGRVAVEAQSPGWTIFRSVGSAAFAAGQTAVSVPVTITAEQTARIPVKVYIQGVATSSPFLTDAFSVKKGSPPFGAGPVPPMWTAPAGNTAEGLIREGDVIYQRGPDGGPNRSKVIARLQPGQASDPSIERR